VRRFSRVALFAVSSVVLASSGIAASISSAGAGGTVLVNSLTILKTVSGEVPAGTTFTVSVDCNTSLIDNGGSGTDSATVEFDETGQPTTADTIDFNDNTGWCDVTETVDGGATSTTYECEGVVTAAPVGGAVVDPICSAAGPTTEPIRVTKSSLAIDATVTVNNTFPEPTPTTTTTTPAPKPTAAPAVVAKANFTG
jgi:hypothetical protein